MTEIICHAASRVVHNQDNFILLPSEKKLIARAHQVHPIGCRASGQAINQLGRKFACRLLPSTCHNRCLLQSLLCPRADTILQSRGGIGRIDVDAAIKVCGQYVTVVFTINTTALGFDILAAHTSQSGDYETTTANYLKCVSLSLLPRHDMR